MTEICLNFFIEPLKNVFAVMIKPIDNAKNTTNIRDPQWRNRLARGTYRQYLSYAEVVSSSLTWGN
jgi:hypothetical protein